VPQQIIPGGQNSVLGNPLYASQLGRWLTNQYKPMPLSVSAATANPAAVLSFQPRL
jgi:penicillin amidase